MNTANYGAHAMYTANKSVHGMHTANYSVHGIGMHTHNCCDPMHVFTTVSMACPLLFAVYIKAYTIWRAHESMR